MEEIMGFSLLFQSVAALGLVTANANAEVTINDATIEGGKLIVEGAGAEQGEDVTLEGQFTSKAERRGRFRFEVTYHPPTCMVAVKWRQESARGVVSNCGEQGPGGPAGPIGAVGPAGPIGPAGPPGQNVLDTQKETGSKPRSVVEQCDPSKGEKAKKGIYRCTIECTPDEWLVNAYAPGLDLPLQNVDEHTAVARVPAKLKPKMIAFCMPR
jgi:hypothetical protein